MRVNISNLNKLIKERFRGNQTFFAETADIDRSYLNQILNNKVDNNSSKICNAIIRYCEKNNLNYKEYIFLD